MEMIFMCICVLDFILDILVTFVFVSCFMIKTNFNYAVYTLG